MPHASPKSIAIIAAIAAALVLGAVGREEPVSPAPTFDHDTDPNTGGDTTRFERGRDAFNRPTPNLSASNRTAFFVGNSFFKQNWIAAPGSAVARDGVGPYFNARSCTGCHTFDARGRMPTSPEEEPVALLFRISRGIDPETGAPIPDPQYGLQLQNFSLPGLKPEVRISVDWEIVEGTYPDGSPYQLRKPVYTFTDWVKGSPAPGLLIGPRLAPQVPGVGLLEAIPSETLQSLADPEDADGDGISGKLPIIGIDFNGDPILGRFGWKSEQPTVRHQSAAAFQGDMGLSTTLFPEDQDHAPYPRDDYPTGGNPEVEDKILDHVTRYTMLLGIPGRQNTEAPEVLRGQELFHSLNCASCHIPKMKTGEIEGIPEVSHQTIRPYTDLLLHDMGEDLSDNRPIFNATGSEWRTPPLWGIGTLNHVHEDTAFLHDGRASTLEEAILWHGGEAEPSK
ncbi:MAG: di-heme oxidoredictase family protein, partial [Puniceicoccales bacterium]